MENLKSELTIKIYSQEKKSQTGTTYSKLEISF